MNSNTTRVTRFEYLHVTPEFVKTLCNMVDNGDSAVLLGPRGIGKQIVMAQAQARLTQSGFAFVRLHCESHSDTSADDFRTHVTEAITATLPDFQPDPGNSSASWRDPLRRLLEAYPRRIVFLVANLDALPTPMARDLLGSLRELIDLGGIGRCSAILSGAFELAPLVHGPNSELHVSNQFVLQGFGKEAFIEFSRKYCQASGLVVDAAGEEYVYSHVGGNVLLFRLVMEAVLDHRRTMPIIPHGPVDVPELRVVANDITSHRSVFCDVILRFLTRLESSARALVLFTHLLRKSSVSLTSTHGNSADEDSPTELELCGVAKRASGYLTWASPLMQSLAEQYYSAWTLGDSFACTNEWKWAFRCYRRAARRKLPTGISISNRPRLHAALRAFEAGNYRISGDGEKPVPKLRRFFAGGVRALLGFEQVSFWEFDGERRAWRNVPVDRHRPKEMLSFDYQAGLERTRSRLPAPESMLDGIQRRPDTATDYVMAKLPSFDGLPPECVVLDSHTPGIPLTRDWRGAAESVLNVFIDAYRQARRHQQQARRSTLQQSLLRAIAEVIPLLAGPPERTRLALEAAGNELLKSGFRRVMFSMVDPKRGCIRGVVDCRKPGECDIASRTKWTLEVDYDHEGNPVLADVQQKCVLMGSVLVIPDAGTEVLANQAIVTAADIKAFMLIPLLNRGRVLGTMHVERDDRELPDRDEIAALSIFSSRLADVIEATTGIDGLEEASHEQSQSIFIVDMQDRIRFANRAAKTRFGLELGWQARDIEARSALPEEVLEVIHQAYESEENRSRYLASPDRASLRVVDVRPIWDWRGKITGFNVQIQDLEGIARLLRSLRRFAACSESEELKKVVLDELKELGHEWARLYLIDPETDRLVGHAQFGAPEFSEAAERFRTRTVVLEGSVALLCLDKKKQVILSICDDNPGTEDRTASGVTVLKVKDSQCPPYLKKKPGDRWIDLPLISREEGDKPLGKISVACPDNLTAEQFSHLEIFAEAASAGFAAIAAREARDVVEAEIRRKQMLRVIGETCHQLQGKLYSLVSLSELYPKPSPELRELNEQFESRLKDIQLTLDSVSAKLRPIRSEPREADLLSFLRDVFGPTPLQIYCGSPEYRAEFDIKLLKQALEELILNARKAVGESHRLQMSARVSTLTPKGVAWCRLEIRDNGPGIPAERRNRIFDEFFSEWPQQGTRGTGLGLAFVKSILAEHGGTIEAVDSDPGACFRLEFPRYRRPS